MGIRSGLLAVCCILAFACGKKNGKAADAPDDSITGDTIGGPDADLCNQFGDTCTGNADCCSNMCNAQGKCDFTRTCGAMGATCATNLDCCSVSCVGLMCQAS